MKNRIVLFLLFSIFFVPVCAKKTIAPRAIAMWDFSWLERRWSGAGYEDWDKVLDELTERGYNAVRIDAYPHLVGVDPQKYWVLKEVWNQQVWGSPDVNVVQVQPALNEFLRKCKKRDIKVGLSSWFREDTTHQELNIHSPKDLADRWIATLKTIDDAGLLDVVLYVDLCNEWPGDIWAPYFKKIYPQIYWGQWDAPESVSWMERAIEKVREVYPELPLLFSFDAQDLAKYEKTQIDFVDLFEPHIWMVSQNNNEFNNAIKYRNGRFDPQAYKNVVLYAEELYRSKPEYWNKLLSDQIRKMALIGKKLRKPLVTTECWGIIDYKDWPMLDWKWVKELCGLGVTEASNSGQWVAIATSNFCGPQFVGMWSDVKWHKRMTNIIKNSKIDDSLLLENPKAMKLLKRIK